MTAHDPRVTLTDTEIERLLAAHERVGIAPLLDTVADLIAARLAPIRALADEWSAPESHRAGAYVRERDAANRIRAALDAPVSASQDHDGAEGQGEVPWGRQRVHIHPPYEPTCNERRVDGQLRGACLNDDGTPR